jgi:hypothetical protein
MVPLKLTTSPSRTSNPLSGESIVASGASFRLVIVVSGLHPIRASRVTRPVVRMGLSEGPRGIAVPADEHPCPRDDR